MFEVGMKVVCVDASIPAGRENCRIAYEACGITPIRIGGVYLVSGEVESPNGDLGILLAGERPFTCLCHFGRCGWDTSRFRPLRDNEADARQSWAEMLAGKPVERV